MAESSLPPPPTNSNGLLIGFGLVALVLVGGLVFWRINANDAGSSPNAGSSPALASTPATADHAAEQAAPAPPPPPPPPPPAEGIAAEDEQQEKAPTETASEAHVKIGALGANDANSKPKAATAAHNAGTPTPNTDGCSGTCPNRADAALNQALRQRGSSARNCYNAGLRSNPTLQGKVAIKLRVSPTGSTCSANITNDTLGDPSVTSCILQKFKAGSYPKPNGGCADFEVPLSFVPSN